MPPRVWTFFYGSYMSLDVLREVDLVPGRLEPARLAGFDLTIRPLANLRREARRCVHGVLATATHAELARLYAHARDVLGGTYSPQAVLAETADGALRPALCYLAHDLPDAPADPAYVARILAAAREHGFPEEYLAHIASFAPAGGTAGADAPRRAGGGGRSPGR